MKTSKAWRVFDANLIQGLIVNYGYAAVFVVVLLESSGIPLPGATILVCASVWRFPHELQRMFLQTIGARSLQKLSLPPQKRTLVCMF
jgi:hypothetical protein